MRDSVFSGKKSWRRFKKKGRGSAVVRRFCCVAILLEAAVLVWQYGGADVFALRAESASGEYLVPEEEGGLLEQVFGVRLRIEDGAVEFYRREESAAGRLRSGGAGE